MRGNMPCWTKIYAIFWDYHRAWFAEKNQKHGNIYKLIQCYALDFFSAKHARWWSRERNPPRNNLFVLLTLSCGFSKSTKSVTRDGKFKKSLSNEPKIISLFFNHLYSKWKKLALYLTYLPNDEQSLTVKCREFTRCYTDSFEYNSKVGGNRIPISCKPYKGNPINTGYKR